MLVSWLRQRYKVWTFEIAAVEIAAVEIAAVETAADEMTSMRQITQGWNNQFFKSFESVLKLKNFQDGSSLHNYWIDIAYMMQNSITPLETLYAFPNLLQNTIWHSHCKNAL